MVVNVLMDGATYMEMLDPNAHCLPRSFLEARFSCWQVIASTHLELAAPGDKVRSFATTGRSCATCPSE